MFSYDYSPTIILGQCQDELPLTLDLADPSSGSILISGDPGCGKTRLLNTFLESAARLNPPDQVTFSVVAREPQDFIELYDRWVHCQQILASEDELVVSQVEQLTAMCEFRRNGYADSFTLLVIDDLAFAIQFMDNDAISKLLRLIKHGPRARVRVLCTLGTNDFRSVDERLLRAFRSNLFGRTTNLLAVEYLVGQADLKIQTLEVGSQFCVLSRAGWVSFRLYEDVKLREVTHERGNVVVR